MESNFFLRKELKERFLRDFVSSEKIFFLKKAKESIFQKGFPACEDLYHYCYFLTLRERLYNMKSHGGDGVSRVLFVYGMKDVEEAIKLHEERLIDRRKNSPDRDEYEFIEYFSKSI